MSRRCRKQPSGAMLRKVQGEVDGRSASKEDEATEHGTIFIDSLGITYLESPKGFQYISPSVATKDVGQSQVTLIEGNKVTTTQASFEKNVPRKHSAWHREEVASTSKAHTSYDEETMQCFQCHIIFKNMASKLRHMKRDHPEDYAEHVQRDPHCFQTSHQEERQFFPPPSKGKVMCLYCGKSFTNRKLLRGHQAKHRQPGPLSCTICGRRFELLATLKKHHLSHEDCYKVTGPYICKVCGASYPTGRGLRLHESIHKS